MKRQIVAGGTAALMLGVSSVTLAAEPTWDYMSASWIANGEYKVGTSSEDLEGYQFTAAKGLGNLFFVRAVANNLGADVGGGAVLDASTQQIGGGVHFGVASGLDLWAAVNYDRAVLVGVVGTGFGLEGGARWQVIKQLELGLTYKYSPEIDFGPGDLELSSYEVSAVYDVTPKTGIMLTFSNQTFDVDSGSLKYDFENVIGLGVRFAY